MDNNLIMKMVNIATAKAQLSEFIDAVLQGEQVVICRRNHPVVELKAMAVPRTSPRPIGGGRLEIPDSFFEPLPADQIDPFYDVSGGVLSKVSDAPVPADGERRTARSRKPSR